MKSIARWPHIIFVLVLGACAEPSEPVDESLIQETVPPGSASQPHPPGAVYHIARESEFSVSLPEKESAVAIPRRRGGCIILNRAGEIQRGSVIFASVCDVDSESSLWKEIFDPLRKDDEPKWTDIAIFFPVNRRISIEAERMPVVVKFLGAEHEIELRPETFRSGDDIVVMANVSVPLEGSPDSERASDDAGDQVQLDLALIGTKLMYPRRYQSSEPAELQATTKGSTAEAESLDVPGNREHARARTREASNSAEHLENSPGLGSAVRRSVRSPARLDGD